MIIGINPSSQGFNKVGNYSEAVYTDDIAQKVARIGKENGLDIRVYWGGDCKSNLTNVGRLKQELARALRDNVELFLSFHTDSAGDKRGYTGSLLLWLTQRGKIFGETVTREACNVSGVPFYASRQRTDLLVLNTMRYCPSALIEVMNHSDPDDLRLLLDSNWRTLYANGLVKGIMKYLNIKPKEKAVEEMGLDTTIIPVRWVSEGRYIAEIPMIDGQTMNEWFVIALAEPFDGLNSAAPVGFRLGGSNGTLVGPKDVVLTGGAKYTWQHNLYGGKLTIECRLPFVCERRITTK